MTRLTQVPVCAFPSVKGRVRGPATRAAFWSSKDKEMKGHGGLPAERGPGRCCGIAEQWDSMCRVTVELTGFR